MLVLVAALWACESPAWIEVAPLPGRREGIVGGVMDGKVFIVGGYDGQDNMGQLFSYSPHSNSWRTEAAMPVPRSDLAAAAINENTLLAIGGETECSAAGITRPGICNLTITESYDSVTGNWTTRKPLNVARRGLGIAVDSTANAVYAIGGMNCKTNCYKDDVEYLSVVERWNSTAASWEFLPSMPTPRRDLGTAFVHGKVWVVGGCNSPHASSSCKALDAVEVFDPAKNRWASGPPLPVPLHGIALAFTQEALYVFGGAEGGEVYKAPPPSRRVFALKFDLVTGQPAQHWVEGPPMPVPKYGLAKGYGLVLDGMAYAIGGVDRQEKTFPCVKCISASVHALNLSCVVAG